MKAVRYHEHGGPEVLKYEEAPTPEPGEGEALIRVRACALNRIDIWLRSGRYKTSLPHILGSEFAGDVASTAPQTNRRIPSEGITAREIMPGDRVLIYPGLSDGKCRFCLAGEENLCENFGIVGAAIDGGYAEYAKVPIENVFLMPEGLDYNEAAAVAVAFVTAWHMLITRGRLRPGERVLVHAVGSGIGSAAVQIAKLAGAEVLATASSDEKLEKAKELGADHLINYTVRDFASAVRDLTGGKGVNVVFEHTGAGTLQGSIECLEKSGRLVVAGATTGAEAAIDLRLIYNRQLSIIGSMLGTKRELSLIIDLVQKGRLRPVIDRIMPLSEAQEAHRLLEDRKQFGKIILCP